MKNYKIEKNDLNIKICSNILNHVDISHENIDFC